MDKILKTKFKLSLSTKQMGRYAHQIARDLGLVSKEDRDSFRHAYTSAKLAQVAAIPLIDDGKGIAGLLGIANEVGGIGNTFSEHAADLINNQVGILLDVEVTRDVERLRRDWNLDEKQVSQLHERLLRMRIAQKVKEGTINQHPFERNRVKRTSREGDIFVHEYDRRSGHVQEHSRSKPDKD